MDLDPSVVWDFAGTLVGTFRERPRQLPATVSRVDPDGTVWLSMPGADGLVPASTTADVSADDAVTVEWWGNAYHVTGNGTSPSIGTRAAAALRRATAAAAKVAGEAKGIADAVGQHFWADGNGVHVSNEDGNATGERNILMNSLGILLRQGSAWLASFSDSAVAFYDGLGNEAANIVAQFGADGAVIGRANESHQVLDYHSLQLVDKEGESYFHVSDLRGSSGSIDVEDVYTGDGSTTKYYYSKQADRPLHAYEGVHITVSDDSVTSWSIYGTYVDFATPPSDGSTITITYTSTNQDNKAFTFGERVNGSNVGALSVAEGSEVTASGRYSHAEGVGSGSLGYASHSEGWQSTATGTAVAAHAEGDGSTASGRASHAEGNSTSAIANYSHAEGNHTTASGSSSHAEGSNTTASGVYSHVEGASSTASGDYSHAEGYGGTIASGYGSHAEGRDTKARGNYSHAQNYGTIAQDNAQTAIGKFNDNKGNNVLEVGNGTADNARSNAFAIDWDGNVEAAGLYSATCKTSTVALDTTKVSADSPNAVWSNGVCCTVSLSFKMLTSWAPSGTAVTIGTVPDGYRPRELVYISLYVNAGSGGSGGVIGYIGSNGTIYVVNRSTLTFSANQAYRFTATYAV